MSLSLLWAVLASAFAVSLAQPNDFLISGNAWLALIAWAPLFWALKRTASNRQAALLGAVFGFVSTLIQCYWLAFFNNFAFWTLLGPTAAEAGFAALLGPVLRRFLQEKAHWRPFAVGAVWAVDEFLRTNGFLGFPWGLAPYPFHGWLWFIQIIDVTGLSFIAFLVIAWNAWISDWFEAGWARTKRVLAPGITLLCLTAAVAVYGFWRLAEPRPSDRPAARLALVQQDSNPWDSEGPWPSRADKDSLKQSVDLSLKALEKGRIDMVVWSETSIRGPLQFSRPFYNYYPEGGSLFHVIRDHSAYWLFGNPYAQSPEGSDAGWVNATVLMNPETRIVDYYGKIQQVPFAEHIPLWNFPPVRAFFKSVVGLEGSWSLGRKITVFHIPLRQSREKLDFSTPICFEDAFPWLTREMVARGANVLINLTDDSWSQRPSSEAQHEVAARFRTIEDRVYLVRSTNSGVTEVVDPWGETVAGPLPYYTQGSFLGIPFTKNLVKPDVLVANIPVIKHHPPTFYVRFGDWLDMVFILLLVLRLVLDLVLKRKNELNPLRLDS